MKRLTKTVWKAIGLSCALVLTGCATQPTDQQMGAGLGAVLGDGLDALLADLPPIEWPQK